MSSKTPDSPQPVEAAMQRIHVTVASNTRIVRDALVTLLETDRSIVARSTELRAAGAAIDPPCDVVLADMATVQPELLTDINNVGFRIAAFGLAHSNQDMIVRCARVGVRAFVSSDATVFDVFDSVRAAARNEVRCPNELAAIIIRATPELEMVSSKLSLSLTPREKVVVMHLEHGLSNKQIAAALGISLSTVKNHVHSILQKLHAPGRKEAAAVARVSGRAN